MASLYRRATGRGSVNVGDGVFALWKHRALPGLAVYDRQIDLIGAAGSAGGGDKMQPIAGRNSSGEEYYVAHDEWLYRDARTLLKGLADGSISSRALLEAYVARIAERNPGINAVVAMDLESARRRADEADAARARGESWGPLHGLPVTIKDTYEVPGMPCTAGAPMYRDHRPARPAEAVRRLVAAGAIPFGKTNVPFMASDIQSYNKVHGVSRNPWNPELTPGGSSGGAAAALAAGFTALELGSDIGGSIRIPAHFCGVYGHKPTHGIISLNGHIPGPPGTVGEPDLAVAGPMARSAEDLELLLEVLAGPSPAMQPGWQLKLPPSRQKSLKKFRVLLWTDDPVAPIDSRLAAQYRALEQALRDAGVAVDKGSPLGMGMADFYPLYLGLLGGAMGNAQPRLQRNLLGLAAPVLRKVGGYIAAPRFFEEFLAGMGQSHADWQVKSERRHRLRRKILPVFEQYDVILMPPGLTTALPHQHSPEMPLRKIRIDGQERNYPDMFMWISLATLLGLPATSAPVGVTPDGLPVNIQIVGAPYEDRTTLRFAALLADVMGGFTRPAGW